MFWITDLLQWSTGYKQILIVFPANAKDSDDRVGHDNPLTLECLAVASRRMICSNLLLEQPPRQPRTKQGSGAGQKECSEDMIHRKIPIQELKKNARKFWASTSMLPNRSVRGRWLGDLNSSFLDTLQCEAFVSLIRKEVYTSLKAATFLHQNYYFELHVLRPTNLVHPGSFCLFCSYLGSSRESRWNNLVDHGG